MPFFLSPGVNVSEIDLTTIVPAVGTTEGAFAGAFNWGPMGAIVTISDEVELVNTFGKPDANTFKSFFTSANFLSYARSIRVVRAGSNTTARNATSNNQSILIRNRDDYEINYINGEADANVGQWAARYPGPLGNSLKVSLYSAANGNTTLYNSWTYADDFNGIPGTSTYVSNVNGANDEMHIVVVDEDGKFTGVSNTILEKFAYVSKAIDAKNDDGSSNYFVNVINDRSKYIYIVNLPNEDSANMNWGTAASNTTYIQLGAYYERSLSNGVYNMPTDADLINAYDKFKNPEEVDISLIVTGAANSVVSKYVVDNIAESRKDCVAFVSPQYHDVVNNVGSEADDIIDYRNLYNSSSYAVLDNNW
jgi:hypothetical protein